MSDLFQSVPFAVVLLIIGFVFLVKGADAFVEGCSSIARRYHVPSLIIGMTIVAMGTSLPETAVSVTAAVTGNNALAVSNAVGSNIFNLMVVVGACTLFTSVAVQINTLKIDFPISILCAILLLILGAAGMSLGHIDGVVFIILFLSFILYMIRSAQASREKNVEPGVEEEEYLLEAEEISKMDLIVNRIRMDMVRRGDMMSMEDVTDILGIPILGAIPDDEEIVISTNQGEPLVGMNSFAGQAYLNICKRILGQEVPLMGLEKNKGFFHMFSGLLKRA